MACINGERIVYGRPRLSVDFALILHLRERCNLGWSRVAREYTKEMGQYISKETCKRRHLEIKAQAATGTDKHD